MRGSAILPARRPTRPGRSVGKALGQLLSDPREIRQCGFPGRDFSVPDHWWCTRRDAADRRSRPCDRQVWALPARRRIPEVLTLRPRTLARATLLREGCFRPRAVIRASAIEGRLQTAAVLIFNRSAILVTTSSLAAGKGRKLSRCFAAQPSVTGPPSIARANPLLPGIVSLPNGEVRKAPRTFGPLTRSPNRCEIRAQKALALC